MTRFSITLITWLYELIYSLVFRTTWFIVSKIMWNSCAVFDPISCKLQSTTHTSQFHNILDYWWILNKYTNICGCIFCEIWLTNTIRICIKYSLFYSRFFHYKSLFITYYKNVKTNQNKDSSIQKLTCTSKTIVSFTFIYYQYGVAFLKPLFSPTLTFNLKTNKLAQKQLAAF